MKRFILATCVFSAVALISAFAAAQATEPGAEEIDPQSVELGEIQIKFLNTDYPSTRMDGESWDETEYAEGGKQVSLHRVNRTVDHTIVLIPGYDTLQSAEIVVKASDWKLIKLNKLDRTWRAEKSVKFVAAPPKPKKPVPTEDSEPVPAP